MLAWASKVRLAFDTNSEEDILTALSRGFPITTKIHYKDMIHLAIECRMGKLVDYLLDSDVSPELEDSEGRTPFLLAAELGADAIFRRLVDLGVDKEVVDLEGNNALHLASINGHMGVVKYLVNTLTFKPSVKNYGGKTVINLL
jgi:ankyrin repeat protein